MFEDHGSLRIDLACPRCQQVFKVRLRKLQFGADLTCRLCRHEFSAKDVSDRPEVKEALLSCGRREVLSRPRLPAETPLETERASRPARLGRRL